MNMMNRVLTVFITLTLIVFSTVFPAGNAFMGLTSLQIDNDIQEEYTKNDDDKNDDAGSDNDKSDSGEPGGSDPGDDISGEGDPDGGNPDDGDTETDEYDGEQEDGEPFYEEFIEIGPDFIFASVIARSAEADIRDPVEFVIYIGGFDDVYSINIEFEAHNLAFIGASVDESSGFKLSGGTGGNVAAYSTDGAGSKSVMTEFATLAFNGIKAGEARLTLKGVEAIARQSHNDEYIVPGTVFSDPVAATEIIPIPEWTVTFNLYDNECYGEVITEGETVAAPDGLEREADADFAEYELLYWIDINGNEFDFGTPIMEDIALTAVWEGTPYSPFDLNKSGAVDRVDLAIAMATDMHGGSLDTQVIGYDVFGDEILARKADVTGTYGLVDILDFLEIWHNFS